MPLFERNGFIVRMDEYIWDLTCQNLRMWLDKGYKAMPVLQAMQRRYPDHPSTQEAAWVMRDEVSAPAA